MDCVDFFASLPLEIVLNIFSYLDSNDAVSCLAVSKLWREIVCAQDMYWRKACLQFGLPDHLIEEHLLHKKCCASPVALFLAAKRQRHYICGSNGVFSRLERTESYPQRGPYRTQSIGSGYILEVYNNPTISTDNRLVLLGRINDVAIEKICELSPIADYSQWRNILPHHQCIVTVKPTAERGPRGMQWLKHAITHESPPQPLSVPFPVDYDYSSPRPTVEEYSACSHCSLMVRGAIRMPLCAQDPPGTNRKTTWLLTFIAFDHTGELLHVHAKNVDPHDLFYSGLKMILAPCSSGHSVDNICGSHNIFLQSEGQSVGIHHVETISTPQLTFDVTPVAHVSFYKPAKYGIFYSSEMSVSSDGKLLGILQRRYGGISVPTTHTLYIWSVTLSSCAKVSEVSLGHSSVRLYSLGHTYAIIGFHSCVNGGNTVSVVVISTYLGETVWECVKPVKMIAFGSCGISYEPEIEFLAMTREEWLSNVHTVSPPLVPFMVFENRSDKRNLFVNGLSFHPSE